jgi:hypothetical protein
MIMSFSIAHLPYLQSANKDIFIYTGEGLFQFMLPKFILYSYFLHLPPILNYGNVS